MAKNIRWKIPFVSIGGTHYRIDIYDEESQEWDAQNPVTLTGGTNPFVTSEDDSDDYFAPIRTQTGTIEVCTLMPDGNYITLDDLLPANNIARPVKLWRILGGGAAGVLEWQGFLSCEAYDQDYTSIPQILQLPVISVLEAMASVEVDTTRVNGLKQTRYHLYNTLTEFDRQIGMPSSIFKNIFYSKASVHFMTKYIDATILYNINEYTNEESHTYEVGGLSCKEVLTRLCTYMGWCCRENATSIYLCRVCEDGKMYTQPLSNLGGTFQQYQTRTEVTLTTADMSALQWMGTNHKRNIRQGAKSVEVAANLERYELKLGLPEFPTNDMVHGEDGPLAPTMDESYAQMNNDFNNMLTFAYAYMAVRQTGTNTYDIFQYGSSDVEASYEHCALNPDCVVADYYKQQTTGTPFVNFRDVGAFFAMLKFNEWMDGLYITAINAMEATDYQYVPSVFKIDSIINYRLMDGTLRFKVNAMTVTNGGTTITQFMGSVQMKLQFGNRYWNGSSWQTTATFFDVDFANSPVEDDNSGYVLEIPITSELPLYGSVKIEIRGAIKGGTSYTPSGQPAYFVPFYDLFISELQLEYEAPEYVTENDRSENKYYRLLGTNFRDAISVSSELASNLNNRPSPSLVMNSESQAMMMMIYNLADGTTEQRRPEVDLLNRLASYYGTARQTLNLIVKHPTAAALPLLKLNGINDGKQYLPLAESRDWREETCTLTCFETPQEEPSES